MYTHFARSRHREMIWADEEWVGLHGTDDDTWYRSMARDFGFGHSSQELRLRLSQTR